MPAKAPYRTRQQKAILCYLQSTPGEHHTVASLKNLFDSESVHIGTATIYRQLEKLIDEGLVRKYILENEDSACYEYVGASETQACPHFHCKCEKCGKLIHLTCDELNAIQVHLLENHGFSWNSGKTTFYGICRECRLVPDDPAAGKNTPFRLTAD